MGRSASQSSIGAPSSWKERATGILDGFLAPLRGRRIEGFLDRIIADEAVGWAFDADRPGRRVLVVVRLDGKVVAESLADLPRRDLEGARKGDGRCGFRIRLPSDLSGEAKRSLMFEGQAGLRRRRLKLAGRFRYEESSTGPGLQRDQFKGPTAGFLERFSGGVLKGWAVDPNNPDEPAMVDIFHGEKFLGSVRAEIDRPRLRETGAPSGARGFEFRAPPGLDGETERLRARIAGTRIDLRRSRAYDPEGVAGSEAGSPIRTGDAGAPAPPAAPMMVREGVVLIVCGAGAPAEVETTLADCRAQRGAAQRWTYVAPDRSQDRESEERALREMIDAAHWAVFLAPGQRIAPDLASRLLDMEPAADVLCWDAPGAPPLGHAPGLAVRLGGASNGLAVRCPVLAGPPARLASGLPADGLVQMETWAAHAGLAWSRLDGPSATPAPVARTQPPATVPQPGRRLSLAVWSGWEEGLPPALKGLLAGAEGFDVEVLVPTPLPLGAAERLRAWLSSGARSLDLRRVEAPAALSDEGLWRAMGQAATGQAVIFAHGRILPPPKAVRPMAAWATQPDVGAVTIALTSGPDTCAAGLSRPIETAAPAALMAVSRAALAEVGGFPIGGPYDGPADLALGRRLSDIGRSTILLGGYAASTPPEILRRWDNAPATGADRRAPLGAPALATAAHA